MKDGKPFKVLLYFDGSQHSLSAAVYTADLFDRIPDMQLTILQIQENVEGTKLEECNLMEIWSSTPSIDTTPSVEQNKSLLEKAQYNHKNQHSKIIAKINKIFFETGLNVKQKTLFANSNIPDTADAIIDFATKKHFELIIMGTRGPSSLKGLVYGSLAHYVLNKSNIPVLLIKKLPHEFIDSFCP